MAEWQRKIETQPAKLTRSDEIRKTDLTDLLSWLQTQALELRKIAVPVWLLAHSDDGINWGVLDQSGDLIVSRKALADSENDPSLSLQQKDEIGNALKACPELRAATLQQARLFNTKVERLLWRDGDGNFHSRVIADVAAKDQADWSEAFDEPQVLWGSHGVGLKHGFTLLRDGAQGLRHALPCGLAIKSDGSTTSPRLVVRHYLAKDEVFARVVSSRLTALK